MNIYFDVRHKFKQSEACDEDVEYSIVHRNILNIENRQLVTQLRNEMQICIKSLYYYLYNYKGTKEAKSQQI